MTDIQKLRQAIMQQMQSNPNLHLPDNSESWWLLGTSACHLCDQAEQLLTIFSSVHPIQLHKIDISYFEQPLMTQFATVIPVLLTETTQLNYPFSIMDLENLLATTNY